MGAQLDRIRRRHDLLTTPQTICYYSYLDVSPIRDYPKDFDTVSICQRVYDKLIRCQRRFEPNTFPVMQICDFPDPADGIRSRRPLPITISTVASERIQRSGEHRSLSTRLSGSVVNGAISAEKT